MDLVERAGHLKPMLVNFAMSPRFDRELSAVIARDFPGGVVTDESLFSMVLDHFVLQHRLPSGGTVVEAFIAAHPELTDAERGMLLGWRDVVEGIFEVTGKDRDALVLFNFLDELTYRARSNLGRRAFRPLKRGMIVVGRLVRAGEDWMVSGNPAAFPASARNQMLAAAAEQALRNPEAVFRNPAKLAEARRILAQHHKAFVDLFGADLIVVPGTEVPAKVEKFHHHLAQQARPGAEPPRTRVPGLSRRHPRRRQRRNPLHHGRRTELLPRLPPPRGTVQQPRADLPPPLPRNPVRLPARPRHLTRTATAARRPRPGQGQHDLRQAPQSQTRLLLGRRRGTTATPAQTQLLRRDTAAPDCPALRAPVQRTPARPLRTRP